MSPASARSFVSQMFTTGQQSNDLEAPMWIVYLAIPLGSGLMCFRFLQVAWSFYRTGELPHHDAAQIDGVEVDALHPRRSRSARGAEGRIEPAGLDPDPAADPDRGGLLCACRRADRAAARLRAVAIVFALLLSLMLTGMPISIALGLTVLSFMFTLTDVRIESVALKLFTGIESFEIMAIPFFILAGNFLTHGGVARRMIAFATAMVGHWYGGLALAGGAGLRAVRRDFGLVAGHRGRDRLGDPAGDGGAGLPEALRRRRHHHLGLARHPDSAVDPDGAVTRSRPILRSASCSSPASCRALRSPTMLGATTWYRAWRNDYPRMPKASFAERLDAFRKSIWGLLLIVIVIGGIYSGLFTPTEAAAVSAVYAFIVAVFVYKDLKLRDVPKVLLSSANLSAMLLYIITNAVLFSFLMTYENIPHALATG